MIDPRFLSLPQWTDAVNLTLAAAGPTTVVKNDDWLQWACNIVAIPKIASFSPPDPRWFSDWRQWAERFVETVPL